MVMLLLVTGRSPSPVPVTVTVPERRVCRRRSQQFGTHLPSDGVASRCQQRPASATSTSGVALESKLVHGEVDVTALAGHVVGSIASDLEVIGGNGVAVQRLFAEDEPRRWCEIAGPLISFSSSSK